MNALRVGILMGIMTLAPFVCEAQANNPQTEGQDYIGHLTASLKPTRTIVYKKVGDRELHLYVFDPKEWTPGDRRPCFFSIHGGGWNLGSPSRQYPFAEYFAKLGMVGISIEYRLYSPTSGVTVFDCVKDSRSAMRYVRAHAAEMGIDPQKIIANGGSAGGHLAAGLALFDDVNAADDDTTISTMPNALVLYFPVIDTSKEGYGNSKIGSGWRELSPVLHMHSGLPPTIIFVGSDDTTTPVKGDQAFQDVMLKAGNRCELVIYQGGKHGYLMHTKTPYDEAVQKTETFLETLGFLSSISKN